MWVRLREVAGRWPWEPWSSHPGPWLLIGGRPPIAPTGLLPLLHRIEQSTAEQYSWERRTCNCWCTGSSRGGNGFGRGAGLRKVCSCGVFEEMVKSIRTRSRITWISCCLSCRPLCELGFPVCCSSFPGSGKEWKPLGRPSFSLPPLLKDKIDPTNTGLEFPITNG